MGTNWFKNLVGFRLNEEDMKDIPLPLTEMYIHITTKTVQAAAIIGSFVTAPLMTIVNAPKNVEKLRIRFQKHMPRAAVVGLVLGPVATYGRLNKEPWDAINDRSYRLRLNRNQVRVDRGSIIGSIAGLGLGAKYAVGLFPGAMGGIAVGTLATSMYNVIHGDKHT